MSKLSPWFNAKTQPPVNGGPHDLYEVRCPIEQPAPRQRMKHWISVMSCPKCQWRGTLK